MDGSSALRWYIRAVRITDFQALRAQIDLFKNVVSNKLTNYQAAVNSSEFNFYRKTIQIFCNWLVVIFSLIKIEFNSIGISMTTILKQYKNILVWPL